MSVPVVVTSVRATRVGPGRRLEIPERVATEEPLEIRLGGPGQEASPVVVTMRTPGHDFELAVGLVYTEGLARPEAIAGASYCDAVRSDPELRFNTVTVRLRHDWSPPERERRLMANASCGVCGKASIEDVWLGCQPSPAAPPFPGSAVVQLPGRMRKAQRAFDQTGGLHAAALFDSSGDLCCTREDIGRHNAVDKVIGNHVLDLSPRGDRTGGPALLGGCVLMVSGRVSFEIVQKAAIAGLATICAVSAPSSLAVQAADRLGLGLAGFVRGDTYNVYAHPERFDFDA